MSPARTSKRFGGDTKLLAFTSTGQVQHSTVHELIHFLNAGDLVVVNRSATLPSSFRGFLQRTGEFVEIRLAAFQGPDPHNLENWLAFSFGQGDWKVPTEDRLPPPQLEVGDKIIFGADLSLKILNCKNDRLLAVKFLSSELEKNLYLYGKPIQYSYLTEELKVWDQQTIFSGPPISVEPPSASFPLTWEIVFALRCKGVQITDLLHGAGLSSTGSAEHDQLLPLTEWYDIPARTAEAFHQAKIKNKKIVALGTTVLRAMESALESDRLRIGAGLTSLKILPGHKIQTANALITGMHEVGTSHMNMLDSFCPKEDIRKGYSEAEQLGYRGHEYGDIAYIQCR